MSKSSNGKLPTYFKEYLDERFESVLEKIEAVSDSVSIISASVEETKKNMGADHEDILKIKGFIGMHEKFKGEFQTVKDKCDKLQAFQYRIIFILVGGTFIWIKESRDFMLKALLSFISAF